MSRLYEVARGALLLGAAGAVLASCDDNGASVLGPAPADNLFASYVAIGNSITAGYQSGGINDSTQRQSFAMLLARQMHTRYAYPALTMPGCPPPINNTLAGTRVTPTGQPPSTGTTCVLRIPSSATAVLNNVAVPGFATADPTQTGTNAPSRNTLAQLFLGGKSMIAKALDAQPTFATVWIGNNDILQPALGGFPAGATPLATFTANYSAMINDLMTGAPALKGVLIGVVQVSGVPLLFQAGLIDASLAVRGAASQVAGRPVVLDPITCAGTGAGALVNFQYLAAIRSRAPGLPGTIYCQKVLGGGSSDPGDNGILDIAEQANVTGLINSYNAYIKAKADSIGFAYYDPNVAFASLKQSGAIPPFPNLASTTATFGQYISLDGVHPAAAAHMLIANELIGVINTKYGTHLIAAQ